MSKKDKLSAIAPTGSTIAIDEKEEDSEGEDNGETEEVIEADVDEDESDEGGDDESEEGEEGDTERGEAEEDKGREESDDAKEDGGAEVYEREETPPKSVKTVKEKTVTRAKNTTLTKKVRGEKGSGGKGMDTGNEASIGGKSGKVAQKDPATRKRKVVQFAPEPKVDNKRGKKVGKKVA